MSLIVIARPEMVPVAVRAVTPVPFIVGVDRSGTTLLRLMLDAHPDLAIPPETHFIPDVVEACASAARPADTFLDQVINHARWKDHHLDAALFKEQVLALDPFTVSEAVRIFYRLYAERCGKPHYGDKTPAYMRSMAVVQSVLPEARFVHIIRDGRDVSLSLKATWWGPKTLPERAEWWAGQIQTARDQSGLLAYYLEVRYEDLISDTEAILKKICAFLDLPWNPAVLDYHQRAEERLAELSDRHFADGTVVTGEQRRGLHTLTGKPPDPERSGRWKKEMSREDLGAFEAKAGEILSQLGYESARGSQVAQPPPAPEPVKAEPASVSLQMKEKRLLFTSYHCYVDPSSGAAQSARDLLPLLAQRGWNCRVFSGPHLDFEDCRPFRQVMNSPSFGVGVGPLVADRPCTGAAIPCSLVDFIQGEIPITVFDAPGTRSLQDPAREEGYVFLAYFERMLDSFRPHMILTYGGHWLALEMMAAAYRRGIPIAFWLHNCFYHTTEFFRPMAGVIVPSNFAREHYRAKLGLEFTELPPPLDWPGRVCDKVEGKYVTFVNPQPDKGVFVFAAIAEELHRRRPDIPFLVVEGRSKLSWLRNAGLDLDKLGNVFGMAATTDPRSFYRVSKMVLMPSLWDETFGRVASEALANGIPVLAARRGGLPEALAEAGFLFDVPAKYTPQTRTVPTASEIAPWVETIVRLWDDQAFYDSEQQRCRTAATVWRPERIATIYDEYLLSLLGKARSKAIPPRAEATPFISVVMPVHNGSAYLERAVQSLLQQSFADWELLVVDDGSTDQSHEMLARYAVQDPRIRVFKMPVNRGPSAARNHALGQARGEMIAYLDCDDEFYPHHFAQIHARRAQGEVLIFGYDVIDNRPESPTHGRVTVINPIQQRELLLQKEQNITTGLGVVHRRELLSRTGAFNETLSFEEDWDLWKRFIDAGAKFAFFEQKSGLYHTRTDSLSRTRRMPDEAREEGQKGREFSRDAIAERGHSRSAIASRLNSLPLTPSSDSPIFLLSGGGRTGSTLIQRLLLSTRQAFIWGEHRGILIDNLLRIRDDMKGWLSWEASGNLQRFLENGYNTWAPVVNPDLPAVMDGCRMFLERTLGQPARELGYPRWGFKEIRYGREVALFLQELFPDARFLLLMRDPAACLQSIKSTGWYGPDFGSDPAAFLQTWSRLTQELVDVQAELPQSLLVRYEDFLVNQVKGLQSISDLVGIPVKLFDRGVLEARRSGTNSPPQPLDEADWQALREASVQSVAEKLGYELKDGVLT